MTQEELEKLIRMQQEQQEAAAEQAYLARRAQLQARETQRLINEQPRLKHAVIVATDLAGGFSKDGKIPWHYPEDFAWFKNRTKGHVCVMGRKTYDEINEKLSDKGESSVLPERRCFVVTSTDLPRNNATRISSISDVEKHISFEDIDAGITVFYIGGEQIYRESIAKADKVYLTVVNKDVEAHKFFPIKYLTENFVMDKLYEHDTQKDIRFTIWNRAK